MLHLWMNPVFEVRAIHAIATVVGVVAATRSRVDCRGRPRLLVDLILVAVSCRPVVGSSGRPSNVAVTVARVVETIAIISKAVVVTVPALTVAMVFLLRSGNVIVAVLRSPTVAASEVLLTVDAPATAVAAHVT